MSRTIAIGDVHGFDQPLEGLIERLDLQPNDYVIQVGDMCDRGPDTCWAIEILIKLQAVCRVEMILGNHDEMMLAACGRGAGHGADFWRDVGGKETIASYGSVSTDIWPEHLNFLSAARPYIETDHEIFVHAMWEPGVPPHEQSASILRWTKVTGAEPAMPDGRRIVCGHNAQKSKRPLLWDGWVCIDTCVYCEDGRLTALDVTNDLVYQAGPKGQTFDPVLLKDIAMRP